MENTTEYREVEVQAYSGYKANERPICFVLGNRKVEVRHVLLQWRGTEKEHFRVLGSDGRVYELAWNRDADTWSVLGNWPQGATDGQ